MKVYVSVDMEGASGIVSRKQCTENSPRWHEARHLLAGDVNAAIEGALAAGATVRRPVADQFYGDRVGTLVDPYGHVWSIGTHREDVSVEEMQRRMASQQAS